MSALILRWLSVALLLGGILILTFPDAGPWAAGIEGRAHYIVVVAYFVMLLGAVGLSIGWFLKRRR